MATRGPTMESPNGLNLVVVVIDTLRYDHVAALPGADPEIETPNFDRLAERSWRFTNAYASSYPTIPCRNDLMTGRYGAPFHLWTPLGYDRETLPESLIETGYVTQLIHDTPHLVNGGHRFEKPFQAWTPIRGAEVDRPWITDSWEWPDNWARDDRFDDYEFDHQEVFEGNHALPRYVQANRDRESEEDWNVAKLFSTAAKFLEDNAARENFFLWLDCFDPHGPWDAPPEFVRKYDDAGDGHIDPRSFRGEVTNDPDLNPAAAAHIEAQYKAKVSFVDRWFGTFLDTLEATGLADNTAVLFMSDHGCNLGDHPGRGYGKAGPPLDNEAHVPLLLAVPGGGSGRCDALAQPQDVFATMAELGGADLPPTVESHDLLEVARNDHDPRGIALSGTDASNWQGAGPGDVLFTAYDGEWCLGVTPEVDRAKLWRVGEHDEIADANAGLVEDRYDRALAEIERRELDPKLSQWLRRGGGPFPTDARMTDSPPRPDGWRSYWDPPFYR